jgi:hypothetical protein
LADGLVQLCDAYAKAQISGGRERPTILITIPVDAFTGDNTEPGVTANGEPSTWLNNQHACFYDPANQRHSRSINEMRV